MITNIWIQGADNINGKGTLWLYKTGAGGEAVTK